MEIMEILNYCDVRINVTMYVKCFSIAPDTWWAGNKWSVRIPPILSPALCPHHPSWWCSPWLGSGKSSHRESSSHPGVMWTLSLQLFQLELMIFSLRLWHCRVNLHIPRCIVEFSVQTVSWNIILSSLYQTIKELPQLWAEAIGALASLSPL